MVCAALRTWACGVSALSCAAAAAQVQCNCTCDATVPSCYGIANIYMNESGGSPDPAFLTAGPGGGGNAEVRHANRFNFPAGTTITHVCIALKNPSTTGFCSGGDAAYIFTAPTGLGNLPGGQTTVANFIVQPCLGLALHHQLVEISPPLVVGGDLWVGVGYPTAQATIGHQGVRARTANSSAVYIGGATDKWFNYDDPLLPPFNARAPIIRPLRLVRANGIVYVTPVAGLSTDEWGVSAQFDVVLGSAPPTANVLVDLSSSDPGEGLPTVTQLVFTPLDWNLAQTVTVVGQDDPILDGPQPYQIDFQVTSADGCYDQAPAGPVFLTNYDNDQPCALRWQRLSIPGPLPRAGHAMAYDRARDRVVLFGGRDSFGTALSDLWEFDPATNTWTPLVIGGPMARYGHTLTYDSSVPGVVLAGGWSGFGAPFGDAWSWNGAAWSPLPALPARRNHAGCEGPGGIGMVVTRGVGPGGLVLGDTLERSGIGAWTPVSPPPGGIEPVARASHAMGWWSAAGTPVVFGGEDVNLLALYGDTWTYSGGGNWNDLTLGAGSPGARADTALADLPTLLGVALFGGRSPAGQLADTWVLELPGAWSQQLIGTPPPRYEHAMAAIDSKKTVLLFGGQGQTIALGDTWELSDPTYPTVASPPDLDVDYPNAFTLAVTVTPAGNYTYQWFGPQGGVANGGRFSGADTATLTVAPSKLSDSGAYFVMVSRGCGPSVMTAPALVDVSCLADFNNNKVVTVQDLFDFLAAWFAQCDGTNPNPPCYGRNADVNGTGSITVQDLFDFLAAWFAKCP